MDLDAIYGALAHKTRRALLAHLAGAGPTRVTALAASFSCSLAATSKHIQVLEAAGLINREVVGRDHFLSLDAAPLAGATAWIEDYRQFWERRADALEARLRDRRKHD